MCQLGVILLQLCIRKSAAKSPRSFAQRPGAVSTVASYLSRTFSFDRLGDMNKTIGITVAKARLFEIIDRVEFGETIIIVRNGAPVAQLRPLEPAFEDMKRDRFAKRRKQSRASIAAASRAMSSHARPDQSVFP